MIPLLIALFYLHQAYLNDKISNKKYLIFTISVLMLQLLTKYNSLFILFSLALFAVFLKLNSNKKYVFIIISMLSTCVFFVIYIYLNKYLTGHFTGIRGISNEMSFLKYTLLSLFNIPTTLEPYTFSFIKILYQNPKSFWWKIPYLVSFISFIFLLYLILKKSKFSHFNFLCFITGFTFLVFSFISAYFTRIDVLNCRLLLGFSLPFLLGFIALYQNKLSEVKSLHLISIGCFSIIFHLISVFNNGFT